MTLTVNGRTRRTRKTAKADGAERVKRTFEEVPIDSRATLRDWLDANHDRADIVDECLCFGWIDSVPGRIDARRWKLRISPRDPTSNRSGVDKRKIARLEREGRMTDAGRALVETARANGAWTFLDEVERLVVPPDLVAALKREDGARDFFERFPGSSKRGILEWIKCARRDATREKRVRETAEKAARNLKANFPPGRDAGPAPPDGGRATAGQRPSRQSRRGPGGRQVP